MPTLNMLLGGAALVLVMVDVAPAFAQFAEIAGTARKHEETLLSQRTRPEQTGNQPFAAA